MHKSAYRQFHSRLCSFGIFCMILRIVFECPTKEWRVAIRLQIIHAACLQCKMLTILGWALICFIIPCGVNLKIKMVTIGKSKSWETYFVWFNIWLLKPLDFERRALTSKQSRNNDTLSVSHNSWPLETLRYQNTGIYESELNFLYGRV